MKNILNITGLLAVILLTAGCRDTGHDVSVKPTFNVVNADVSYTASGGEGIIGIELLKQGTPEITVEKDWCGATVSGGTITVSVDPNTDSYSRETALTITVDGYSRTFGIYQGGIYYYAAEDFGELGYKKDDELRIPLIREGSMNLEIVECSDWAAAYLDGDEIVVTALENNGMTDRTGYVIVKAGVQRKTVNFVQSKYQMDYYDYLGNWTFTYYTAANSGGTLTSRSVTFAIDEEGKSYKCTGLTYPFIVSFIDNQLRFYVGQVVGTYAYTDGNTYDVSIRLVNSSGTATAATANTLYMYSSFEMVDGSPVVSLIPSNTTTYYGFNFAITISTGGIASFTRYYTGIKLHR